MNCPSERGQPEILLDYCAGKLSAQSAKALNRHLAACALCAEVAARQQTVWSALEAWDEIPVSPDFNRRLYARIEQEEARHGALVKWARAFPARWNPFSWRPILPAAALAATVIAALLIQTPATHHQHAISNSPNRLERIDVDQVERALDDLDMLKQVGAVAEPPSQSSM